MTDWTAIVREHLHHAAEDPAREAEIIEELAQHLAQREAELRAAGVAPNDARRRVLNDVPEWPRLASAIRTADRPRPMAPSPPRQQPTHPMAGLWDDLRYAARTLRRAPGYAAGVVLILAVALGAATATFSIVNGVLLRPLPYDEPGQLVRLYDRSTPQTGDYVDGPTLSAVRRSVRSFSAVGGAYTYRRAGADLTGHGMARRVSVLSVTAGYFEVLLTTPLRGRTFTPADERKDANLAVVSEVLAGQLCGNPSACVGQTVMLDAVPTEVVGVMPRRFRDPISDPIDVWTPHVTSTSVHNHYISVIARLARGATVESANTELGVARAALNHEYRGAYDKGHTVAVSLHEDSAGRLRTILVVLLGAVGLVLLIACVNVSHLVLARGLSRERELAIRAAIGCGRWQLARQALAEQLVLGAAGGTLGALLAWGLVRVLLSMVPGSLVRPDTVVIDRAVFLFGATAAFGAALIAGLPTAIRVFGGHLETLLRTGTQRTGGGRARSASGVLVAAQVALSVVVLGAATLLIATFVRLSQVELGFQEEGVVTFEVNLPAARYPDGDARTRIREQLSDRFDAIPGVAASGRVSRLPVSGVFNVWTFRLLGRSDDTLGEWSPANVRTVDGRYFQTLGIPLVRGRLFDRTDRHGRPGAMIVSEALVRAYFPDDDPVGRRIRLSGQVWTVVGIVRDVYHDHRMAPAPTLYLPHAQMAGERNWAMTEVIRVDGSRPDIVAALRHALTTLDPELVVHDVLPLEDVVARDLAAPRFSSTLMTGFAVVGLLLAALGLAAVLSYSVSERTREIGVRMALGATGSDVRRMVVGAGLKWVAFGLAAGLPSAIGAWRLLGHLVTDVDPLTPGTVVIAALVMLGVAVVAAAVPARRATQVDPLRALRSE
ncbi:MAG: ABC transporter permease [Vicinamibacterales bacterium]|nr:ABC transporter permease [Vicinamibacterales bacterium]